MTTQPTQLDQYKSRLRDALGLIHDLKDRLDALESRANEPIAVIGKGCRFPGGGAGPEAFWQVLEKGIDAVQEIPNSRWPRSAIPGERQEARWAALLDDLEGFDASFFGISPREAETLDPQQRLLLETTWEALENAGERPDALVGSRTGVFIGICNTDYRFVVTEARADHYDAYCATGTVYCTTAGRVSFVFGLQGPAISMDTACSSSLVAIAQACQSLRAGDSNLAIAGGVNVILSPLTMAQLLETQALSPDGRCKALDARANGFVRGEGCGLFVLKRLSDALRDGDTIHGLILAWAINQDGRSTGLTTPNVLSQQDMLRQTLTRAKLMPADIGYVEMHGTGTALGDPIEAEALRDVLGAPRPDGSKCVLGAVKTNIGHLEGAAGAAGIMKILLSFEHERIPKNLHFRRLNPRISFDGTPFVVPTESMVWQRGDKPRRAGVSSFGISGTNAHIILEEPPARRTEPQPTGSTIFLLPLSAKSPRALSTTVKNYSKWLSAGEDPPLSDVVYTASVRRMHHEYRLAIVGRSREEFVKTLDAVARGEFPSGVVQGQVLAHDAPQVVFVFSGQGSQWAGMGTSLFQDEPIFRTKIEEIDALMRNHASINLLDILRAPEDLSRLDETEIVQPALFAIQVGLFELFKSWGINPGAVIGHSVGEVAAAHVCGAISLEEAVRLVVVRGRVMQKATGHGKMVWVALPVRDVEEAIRARNANVAIAAINDPGSVVLSGETRAIDTLIAEFEAQGIGTRPLRVNYAFHSPQMEPLAIELSALLKSIDARSAELPMYSTVTGGLIDGTSLGVDYWRRNVRATVNFCQAVHSALDDGYRVIVEIGAHPVLLANLEQCALDKKIAVRLTSTLRRNADERRAVLEAVASLHVDGVVCDWKQLNPSGGRVVSLPSYPWQRERYWIKNTRKRPLPQQERGAHPLFGIEFSSAAQPELHVWERELSIDAFPYLEDHRVQGEIVFPGAGYVEMALAAAWLIYGDRKIHLEEIFFEQLLGLSKDDERVLQIALREETPERGSIAIFSKPKGAGEWVRHAHGTLCVQEFGEPGPLERTDGMLDNANDVDAQEHYERLEQRGLSYGRTFRGVREVRVGTREALAFVQLPNEVEAEHEYRIHPALLDACFQAASWALQGIDGNDTFVPVSVGDMRMYHAPSRTLWLYARIVPDASDRMPAISILASDKDGRPLFEIGALRAQILEQGAATNTDPFARCRFDVVWQKADSNSKKQYPMHKQRSWLVLLDGGSFCRNLVERLRQDGSRVVTAAADREYRQLETDTYQLDPASNEQWSKLIGTAFGKQGCQGVLHGGALQGAAWSDTTESTLTHDLRSGPLVALRLAQALLKQGWRELPRFFLLTRGAQAVGPAPTPVSIAQSTVWGLARVIRVEQPDLECTCIDLPSTSGQDELSLLVHELTYAGEEEQIALRSDGRYVARLIRGSWKNTTNATAAMIRSDATYLITGGLGGLGLSLATWMVARGAKYLVLVGRSAPSTEAEKVVREMQSMGANVHISRGNVARRADVDAMLAEIHRDMPPLRGIVHAAGVLADRTLLEMNEEEFFRPFTPKIFGTWNLHEATRTKEMDFFVMYSSIAGLLGSPGQGNYAAANAFLDALGHARTAMGLPGMSIQWGPFSDVGMASADEARGKRLASRGTSSFKPEDGSILFERVLSRPSPTVGLVHFDVRQWLDFYPQMTGTPFLSELLQESGAASLMEGKHFLDELERMDPERAAKRIEMHLLEQVSHVVRLDPDKIDKQTPFTKLGMDSLMSLELRNRLESSLGLKLPAALLFTYSTTISLANHLHERLLQARPSAQPPAVVTEVAETNHSASVEPAKPAAEDVDEAALIDKPTAFEDYLNE
ncbi:MAG TPA: type I polyketide synthase [Polyangium sp.]|nr:type I polyketide synthase [Polyangium sp.]